MVVQRKRTAGHCTQSCIAEYMAKQLADRHVALALCTFLVASSRIGPIPAEIGQVASGSHMKATDAGRRTRAGRAPAAMSHGALASSDVVDFDHSLPCLRAPRSPPERYAAAHGYKTGYTQVVLVGTHLVVPIRGRYLGRYVGHVTSLS